jgi:ribosomal-protein-alanine N-acetyltransferase
MDNPYAIGRTVYLRAPKAADVGGRWYQWFSDPELTQYLGDRFWPNTAEAQAVFYESTRDSRERLVLAVCASETDEHIGVCSLSSINWVHRHADIAFVIGEKAFRNGAVAVEVMSLLLDIAFNRLNLINLRSVHMSSNPHTPLLERMFGFRVRGRLEQFYFCRGEYADAVYSQLSRADWAERNRQAK